jgi:hypothetical protein
VDPDDVDPDDVDPDDVDPDDVDGETGADGEEETGGTAVDGEGGEDALSWRPTSTTAKATANAKNPSAPAITIHGPGSPPNRRSGAPGGCCDGG